MFRKSVVILAVLTVLVFASISTAFADGPRARVNNLEIETLEIAHEGLTYKKL